jgi:hypothetical protein
LPPGLVNPPNVALEKDANKVDEPHKGDTYKKKNDCKYDTNYVLLCKAAAKTVDHPNDCDRGDAENEFDYLRKIVNCFDERIHNKTSFIKFDIKSISHPTQNVNSFVIILSQKEKQAEPRFCLYLHKRKAYLYFLFLAASDFFLRFTLGFS